MNLNPSSAHRRMLCPGSWRMEMGIPRQEETAEQMEGIHAHDVAMSFLKGYKTGDFGDVSEEVKDSVEIYVNHIKSIVPLDEMGELLIEEKFDISNIHELCSGIPDVVYLENENEIHIWDFKYGHREVEAFENWQLLEYACGVVHGASLKAQEYENWNIHLHVVQPRCFTRSNPVDTWVLTGKELQKYFLILRQSEALATGDTALCKPTPPGCRDCKGRAVCEALQKSALDAVIVSSQSVPLEMSPREIGNELRYLIHYQGLLDARVNGLSAQALHLLASGERVEHFEVGFTAPRERWTISPEKVLELGKGFGVALGKPVDVITPKQAIKAGISEQVVRQYSENPSGAMKLVAQDAKKTRKVFK